MATTNRAAAQYMRNAVQTASPAKLTLMLYDGAIRFCNTALDGIHENNIEKASNNIIKAENIITEFRCTLDFKYEVAKDFDNVYEYVYRRMVEANRKKDPEILEEVLEHLHTMRDAWKEVMRINNVS